MNILLFLLLISILIITVAVGLVNLFSKTTIGKYIHLHNKWLITEKIKYFRNIRLWRKKIRYLYNMRSQQKSLAHAEPECDFSGWATKYNIKCDDGRTILPDAFAHHDGAKMPLVYQHFHDGAENVLGHMIFKNKPGEGLYGYGYFNNTTEGQRAKELVQHGDLDSLSIWANELQETFNNVKHGTIREVSLCLSSKNPQAKIDYVNIAHADGTYSESQTEAIIFPGGNIKPGGILQHNTNTNNQATESNKTVAEVFNSMSPEQKQVLYALLAEVSSGSQNMEQSGTNNEGGMRVMKHNVFDQSTKGDKNNTLSHADWSKIITAAQKKKGSLKEAFLAHVGEYGITDIDYLFPDTKTITASPDFIKRRTEWVKGIVDKAKKTPFSRIKTIHADITADEARAKGYTKGNLKIEEVFGLLKRETTPTTIYKKQKLDRDDIIDITDFDVVSWLKAEMRLMLEEEISRVILVGDGRDIMDNDKVNEERIRPIWTDAAVYVINSYLEYTDTVDDFIESVIRSMDDYNGSGDLTLYIAPSKLTDLLLMKDISGKFLYPTIESLKQILHVNNIVKVPLLNGLTRTVTIDEVETLVSLEAIIVDMHDYAIGADKGGETSFFDDFDIDYNQYKYLYETRMSGALTVPKSAIVIERLPQGE